MQKPLSEVVELQTTLSRGILHILVRKPRAYQEICQMLVGTISATITVAEGSAESKCEFAAKLSEDFKKLCAIVL